METTIKCKKCGAHIELRAYDEKNTWKTDVEPGEWLVRNGYYGCDSWCEYVWMELECTCGHEYEYGEFGEFDSEESWLEYVEKFKADYERSFKA